MNAFDDKWRTVNLGMPQELVMVTLGHPDEIMDMGPQAAMQGLAWYEWRREGKTYLCSLQWGKVTRKTMNGQDDYRGPQSSVMATSSTMTSPPRAPTPRPKVNCKRCNASHDDNELTCPNCGRTNWGAIILLSGISMLLIAAIFAKDAPSWVRWIVPIVGGFLALGAISTIVHALTWSRSKNDINTNEKRVATCKPKTCMVCGTTGLKYKNENHKPDFDDVAQECPRCSAQVCFRCLLKLPKHNSGSGRLCPACKKYGIFEYAGGRPEMRQEAARMAEEMFGK